MEKRNIKRYAISFLAAMCMILGSSILVLAAQMGEQDDCDMTGTLIGRYQLNYTGNTNYFKDWVRIHDPDGEEGCSFHSLTGYRNSSTAALLNSYGGNGNIVKAYLIWTSRSSSAAYAPVTFISHPNGGTYQIYPSYVHHDLRQGDTELGDTGKISAMHCMAADVTDYVKQAGYGDYSVCDIPVWIYDGHGGESICSWQLIVVEEGDDIPVRAVDVRVGAYFTWNSYGMNLNLSNGITTKTDGRVTGQVIYGFQSAENANWPTWMKIGNKINQINDFNMNSYLYRNGSIISPGQYITKFNLADTNKNLNLGNGASKVNMYIENPANTWNTYFLLGCAVDISSPNFNASQKTKVANTTNVEIDGTIANVSSYPDTGIYNGKLVVNIDSALTPYNAFATINGTDQIIGKINGNTVTFDGGLLKNMMKGDSICYTIQCSTDNSGKTRFDNRDSFSGYLRSNGVNTDCWINNACTSSSFGIPQYTVNVNKGIGIDSVSGAGAFEYGTNVNLAAGLLPGYHWSCWSGDYLTAQQDYSFRMPNKNLEITANGERNNYTIAFDANGGEGYMESVAAVYDTPLMLPECNFTRCNEYGTSTFIGWAPYPDTEQVLYPNKAEVMNLTAEHNMTITLYAMWDDCPWISGKELYYTLEQSQNGFITQDELLSHAVAEDREDGAIAPGFHEENGTSFIVVDYQESDFTQFLHEGSITETYQVIDSSGSLYQKQITVYIVDTAAEAVIPIGTTRFINEKYFRKSYENGGLEEKSIWKTEPEYTAVLQEIFQRLNNKTPERTYVFEHEQILQMQQFIKENGYGNTRIQNALTIFYQRFMN